MCDAENNNIGISCWSVSGIIDRSSRSFSQGIFYTQYGFVSGNNEGINNLMNLIILLLVNLLYSIMLRLNLRH